MRMELTKSNNSRKASELNIGAGATLFFFESALVAARFDAGRFNDWPFFYRRSSLADAPKAAVDKWRAAHFNGNNAFEMETDEFFDFSTKQIAKLCSEKEGEL